MNQKNEKDQARRSPLSYELIVRNNQANRKSGAPHLILRRKLKEEEQGTEEAKQELANGADTLNPQIVTAHSVSDYISSLNDHVPDDVIRVVDAIIEEEGKMPTNLPKLDDQLSQIYPGSDVQDLPGDDLFYLNTNSKSTDTKPVPANTRTSNYTNRVEYEDL